MQKAIVRTAAARRRCSQGGFTLIEALIALMVLTFGLLSIYNLLFATTLTNLAASQSSAASMLAVQQMETLRSTRFENLTASGTDTLTTADPAFTSGDVDVPGVGHFETRWRIQDVTSSLKFIQVRSESTLSVVGRRSRAEFSTYRACTALGCL